MKMGLTVKKKGGYIDLAVAFEFYNYLSENEDIIKQKTGIDIKQEILHPTTSPNQKWHLMISYLCGIMFEMKTNEKRRMNIAGIFCPELCLWMLETSEIFKNDGDVLLSIKEHAINYKNKRDFEGYNYSSTKGSSAEWKRFIKPYMDKLHKAIMKKYNSNQNT